MQWRFLSWAARMGLLLCGVLLSGAAFHVGAQALRIGGTGSALGTVRLLADALAKQNPTQPGLTVVPNLGSSGGLRSSSAGCSLPRYSLLCACCRCVRCAGRSRG